MPLSLPNKDKKKKKIDEVEERLSPKKVSDLSFSEARAIREQYGSLKNYELATDKNRAKRIDEQMQDLNARRLVDAATSRGTPVEAESYGKNNKWNDYTTVMSERKSDYDRAVEKLKKDLDVYSPIADVSGVKNYLDATKAGYDNAVALGKSAADFGNAFKSADDFKRWSIGWDESRTGDKNFEDTEETRKARKDYYDGLKEKRSRLEAERTAAEQELYDFHQSDAYKNANYGSDEEKQNINTETGIQSRIWQYDVDLEALDADIARYERFTEVQDKYAKLRDDPNFERYAEIEATHSGYGVDKNGNTISTGNNVVDNYFGVSEKYKDVNISDPMFDARYGVSDQERKLIDFGYDYSLDELTEEEKQTYRYLLATQGADSADQFLEDMKPTLNRRAVQREANELKNASGWELAIRNIASVPQNILGGVTAAIADVAQGDNKNPYDKWHRGAISASAVRGETAQRINNATGNANLLGFSLGDTYQALMSAADSAAGAALFGRAYTITMGAGAASSRAKELYENGASNNQILMSALASGLTEVVTEYVSVDKLVSNFLESTPKNKLDLILKMLSQGGIEASEEFAADILNTIQDNAILGSQSEWNKKLKEYMDGGMSREEAQQKVWLDTMGDALKSAAGGFVSGIAMGAPIAAANAVGNAIDTRREGRYVNENNGAEALQNLAREVAGALNLTKAVDKVTKKASNKNVGKLSRALEQAIVNETDAETRSEKGAKYALAREGVDLSDVKAREGTNLYNNVDVSEKISDTGATVDTETGGEITIDEKNPITQRDGKTYLNTSAGEILQDDIKYSSEKEAQLYEYVSDLPQSVANAIVENYKGQENVRGYVNGMRDGILLYGYNNIENAPKNTAFATLDKADQQYALAQGRALAAEDINAKKARIATATVGEHQLADDETVKFRSKSKGAFGTYGQFITKGEVDLTSDINKENAKVAKFLSYLTGETVGLYDSSTVNDETLKNANGKHVSNDGTIYVDVNAGTGKNRGIVAYTLSHELVHEGEQWSAEEYKKLTDFLFKNYAEKGYTVQQLVDRKMMELNTTDEAYARSELIADSLEKMLLDSDALNKLAELQKTDKKLYQRIIDWIKEHVGKLLGLYDDARLSTESFEAGVVETFGENELSELRSLYSEMLAAAAENRTAAVENNAKTEAENNILGDDAHSMKSLAAAGGLELKRENGMIVAYDQNGKKVNKVTAAHINNSGIGALINLAFENKHISAKDAVTQKQGAADLLNIIINSQDGELAWRFAGASLFSAMKSNSDGQYGTTIDFTTVCRKTQEMIDAMSKSMMDLGRGLTKDEVIELQNKIIEEGGLVPCPVCYVFSRWAGIGGILDSMNKWAKKYDHSWDDPTKLQKRIEELESVRGNKQNLRKLLRETDSMYLEFEGAIEDINAQIAQLRKDRTAANREAKKTGDRSAVDEINRKIDSLNAQKKGFQDSKNKLEAEGSPELAWLKKVRTQPGYWQEGVVKEGGDQILFNLAKPEDFATTSPLSWAYRTSRGPGAGKAILPYSEMVLGDLILGPGKTASNGNKTFEATTGEFNDKQKRAIETAIRRTLAQNLIGGQRFQSTSDFRYDYGLDYLQTFWEAQALGSKMQTYTKIVEFAELAASVGGDVNVSVMPLDAGYKDGKLIFSSVTGINPEAAIKLNDMFDNVQLILVGINDEHIKLALSDDPATGGDKIGFVIPYHASGASINNFIAALVSNLGETFDTEFYKDYSKIQTDSVSKRSGAAEARLREIRTSLLTGYKAGIDAETNKKTQTLWAPSAEEQNLIRGKNKDISNMSFDELRDIEKKALAGDKAAITEYKSWSAGVLWNMYQKMWVDKSQADTYGVRLNSKQAEHIMPHEYWNTDVSRTQAYVNGFIFRSYCYNLGLNPRFTGINSDGKNIGYGDFSDEAGYWKTLIDRPMYDNKGKYRSQQTINATAVSKEMLTPEYGEEKWGEFKVDEPSEERAYRAAGKFVSEVQPAEQYQKKYSSYSLRAIVDRAMETLDKGSAEYNMVSKYKTELDKLDTMRAELDEAVKNGDKQAETRLRNNIKTQNGILTRIENASATKNVTALKDTAKLSKDVKNLREMLRLQSKETGGTIAAKSSAEAVAKELMDKYGVKRGKGELAGIISRLYTELISGVNDRVLNVEYMRDLSRDAAEWIAEHQAKEYEGDDAAQEVLDYLKGKKVWLNGQQKGDIRHKYDGQLNKWMGRLSGYVTVTNDKSAMPLDDLWNDLSKQFPAEFGEVSDADQGWMLADKLSDLKERANHELVNHGLTDEQMEEWTDQVTDAVYESLWNIKPMETVADKYEKQITELKEKHRADMSALRKSFADTIREERSTMYAEAKERAREYGERLELRRKVRKIKADLTEKLGKPTAKKFIPADLRAATSAMLTALNNDNENYSQNTRDRIAKLQAIYDSYKDENIAYDEQVSEWLSELRETVGSKTISELTKGELESVYKVLRAFSKNISDVAKVKSLYAAGVSTDKTVDVVAKEWMRNIKKVNPALAAYFNTTGQLLGRPELVFRIFGNMDRNSIPTKVYDMLNAAQREYNRIRIEGNKLFEEMFDSKEGKKYLADIHDTKQLYDIGLKDADGKPIKVTKDFALWLNRILLNENAIRHVATTGGIMPDFKQYYEGGDAYGKKSTRAVGVLNRTATVQDGGKWASSKANDILDDVKLRAAEIDTQIEEAQTKNDFDKVKELRKEQDKVWAVWSQVETEGRQILLDTVQKNIEKIITPQDQKFLDLAAKFYDEWSKNYMNKASNERFGIDIADEENYTRIHTADNFRKAKLDKANMESAIGTENMGFTKRRVGATNPIYFEGLSTAISKHIDEVATYAAYLNPLYDLRKILDFTEGGIEQTSNVKRALTEKFGKAAVKYIYRLAANVKGQSTSELGDIEWVDRLFNKLLGRTAEAALTANGRVIAYQMVSALNAAAELGYGRIAATFLTKSFKKAPTDLIAKYTPVYEVRRSNGSTDEVANMKNAAKNRGVWYAITYPGTHAIQAMDLWTVGRLWFASESYVKKHNKNLKPGTDEFYKAVAKKFTDVVELTQPNYTPMQRNQLQRSKNPLARALTMFKTQPFQNLNNAIGASFQFARDIAGLKNGTTTKAEARESGAKLYRTATSLVASAAMMAVINAVWNALVLHGHWRWKDDETGEFSWEKFGDWMLDEALGRFFSNDPLAGEAYSFIGSKIFDRKYYPGFSMPQVEVVTDALETLSDSTDKIIAGKWNAKKEGREMASKIGRLFGLPVDSIVKPIEGIYLNVQDIINGEFGTFNAGYEYKDAQLATQMLNALEDGNTEKYDKARGVFKPTKTQTADQVANSALTKAIKASYMIGETDKETAEEWLAEYCGKDSKEIYTTLEKWNLEKEGGEKGDYKVYDKFAEAVRTGKDLKAVIKEYKDVGYTEDNLNDAIRNSFKAGYIAASNAERAKLKGYLLNAYVAVGYDKEKYKNDDAYREKKSDDIDKWVED